MKLFGNEIVFVFLTKYKYNSLKKNNLLFMRSTAFQRPNIKEKNRQMLLPTHFMLIN